MNEDTIEGYLEGRFRSQAAWYDARSILYKRLTFSFQIPIIALSVVVPILISLGLTIPALWSSAAVSVAIGTARFGRFERLWHLFRMTHEALESEKVHFTHLTDVYDGAKEAEKLFIERSESLMSRETIRWVLTMKRRKG